MSEAPQRRGQQPPSLSAAVQVARIFGVPVVVQPLWFLIVIVFAIGFAPQVRSELPSLGKTASYGVSLLGVLLLYACVLIHEISHLAVAKALGMQVRRVVLQLMGGVTEVVEENPGRPSRESLVAAVGPLTSLLLGGIFWVLALLFPDGSVGRFLTGSLAFINILLAVFNALPGLPLDGGRVLRALLWRLTRDKARGTVAAAWVGRAIAAAMFATAIFKPRGWGETTFGAFYLVFLAFYMWTAASYAIAQARVSTVLPRLDLRQMTRRALAVAADLPVAEAVRRARDAGARALVVVDGHGKPSGIVSEAAVSALPPQRQPWVSVSDLARPVDPSLVLRTDMGGEALIDAVQSSPATEYLVVDGVGAVCGVLARVDLVAALQAAGLR